MSWRGWGARRQMQAALTADAAAFLLGTYAERLAAGQLPVPVWVWTNLLAHGARADLQVQAASGRLQADVLTWRGARAQLAARVLDAETPGRPLRALQRDVLVPLELSLACLPGVDRWGPRQWFARVQAAIAADRPSRQP